MSEIRERKFMHQTEPAKNFTPIARSAGPMERIIPEDVNIAYEGTRVNKKGETVSAFLAENAIKSLYNGMQFLKIILEFLWMRDIIILQLNIKMKNKVL